MLPSKGESESHSELLALTRLAIRRPDTELGCQFGLAQLNANFAKKKIVYISGPMSPKIGLIKDQTQLCITNGPPPTKRRSLDTPSDLATGKLARNLSFVGVSTSPSADSQGDKFSR